MTYWSHTINCICQEYKQDFETGILIETLAARGGWT